MKRVGICLTIYCSLALGLCGADRQISPYANQDEEYLKLRSANPEKHYKVTGYLLKRDIGTFRLTGTIGFLPPVHGRHAAAVFTGSGEFMLEPDLPWEVQSLRLHTGSTSVKETFRSMVLYFSDETAAEIETAGEPGPPDPKAVEELSRLRERLRKRQERPTSWIDALLNADEIENIEAVTLADILHPAQRGFFQAYMRGDKNADLRFTVRPRGALPQLLSGEEVALVSIDPGGNEEGIWYLAHRREEYDKGTATALEPKAQFDVQRYEIDTRIHGNKKLEAVCRMEMKAVQSGERIIAVSLLPDLRVSSVKDGAGAELSFIQESEKRDGAFYVFLGKSVEKGETVVLTVSYMGEKVIRGEGGGNFAVGARDSWYPTLGLFRDRAVYELTFRYPDKFVLVSVGTQVAEPSLVSYKMSLKGCADSHTR